MSTPLTDGDPLDDETRSTGPHIGDAASNDAGDVEVLYSRVNLEGSKYRDFSNSREEARLRSRESRQTRTPISPESPPPIPLPIPAAFPKISQMRLRPVAAPPPRPSRPTTAAPRWSALKHIIDASKTPAPKAPQPPIALNLPVTLLISFAGGVGKTMLAANLARSFAAMGERTLLVDTHTYGLLPLYFDPRELASEPPRNPTFGDPAAPITLLHADPENATSSLIEQIAARAADQDRILIDVATGSKAALRELLRLTATVLIVLTPDMASVVSLEAIQDFLEQLADDLQTLPSPFFLLNQFDPSLRLHLDILNALSDQLGPQLIPFPLHCSRAVSESLAEGLPLHQYAPSAEIVDDLDHLTQWLSDLSPAALAETRTPLRKER